MSGNGVLRKQTNSARMSASCITNACRVHGENDSLKLEEVSLVRCSVSRHLLMGYVLEILMNFQSSTERRAIRVSYDVLNFAAFRVCTHLLTYLLHRTIGLFALSG